MKKKKKGVNNLPYIIIGAVVLILIGGLIGTSITGNPIFNIRAIDHTTQNTLDTLSECEISRIDSVAPNDQIGLCAYDCEQKGQTCIGGYVHMARLLDPLGGEGNDGENLEFFIIPLDCGDTESNSSYAEIVQLFDYGGVVYEPHGFCTCCSA